MKRLKVEEGTAFLVPLQNGGFARGVVARAAPKGKILFGYFFGPRLRRGPFVFDAIHPRNAVFACKFGDLGLINGEWPIVGQLPEWDHALWRMPSFVRIDPLGKLEPRLIVLLDTDPSKRVLETPCCDIKGLLPDQLFGSGAVEIKLSKLLHQDQGPVGNE